MVKFLDGTVIDVVKDKISIVGKSPSGKHGYWVMKRKERVYINEPTLRYRYYSTEELKETIKGL